MEDQRQEELDCIAAIFPEIQFDPANPFSAKIELPVNPTIPVKVIFPISSDGDLPTPPLSANDEEQDVETTKIVESHNLSYLPSLHLCITLPKGYPDNAPPKFELSTSPSWLSFAEIEELQDNGERMWEEAGRSLVVYGYIDFLQQAAENAFGYAEEGKILKIPQDFKISLLDFDITARQAAFEKETFDCGVCLDPKKGSVCHKMIDCGHVFCVQCLQDFYNDAITRGDITTVQCLEHGCAKKRGEEQVASKKHRKPKVQLSPSELLQIPLEHDTVSRYVKLKHKAELESDKNTIYCPRKWCQGAARSKKHRKPEGLEDVESGDESDTEIKIKKKGFLSGNDLLCVCEDCSFAFCSRCLQGWHGEFFSCQPPRNTEELTEEEKASLEYLKLHTTPCPTCTAPAQKTHGCNHMICFKCNSHFCYLCSSWLSPTNPYTHYNDKKTGCYQRLWELEGGDGDDVGIGFHGGVLDHDEEADEVEDEVVVDLEVPQAPIAAGEPQPEPLPAPAEPAAAPAAVPALQREGPLVLRINHIPPRPPAAPAVVEPRQQPQNNPNARPPLGQAVANRVRRHAHAAARQRARDELIQDADAQEAAQQAWVRMFVQMALNDEEDQVEWDSEDEEEGEGEGGAWEIPVR